MYLYINIKKEKMKKLVSILMILAMIVPLAGAQSTDIFKKKKKKPVAKKADDEEDEEEEDA